MKTINQYKLPEYFYKIAKYKSNDEEFLRIMIENKNLVMMSRGFVDLETRLNYDPQLEPYKKYSVIPEIESSTNITNNINFNEFYNECFDIVDDILTFSETKCYKAILKYFNIIDKYEKMIKDLVEEDYRKKKSEDYKLFNMIFVKYVKRLKKGFDPCIATHLRIMANSNILSALQLARYNVLLKNGLITGDN